MARKSGQKDDGSWGKLIRDIVVILVLVLGIHSCVAKPFYIPSDSMMPILRNGVTGLMTSLARELGQYNIRVNSVNPTCVDTDMINNDFVYGLFRPDLDKPTRDDVIDTFSGTHILPVPWMQPQDVSNAILYLVTEPGRYITATPLVIDAGFMIKS